MANQVNILPKHDHKVTGDFSFMDALLPKNTFLEHIDSYNNEAGKRFQGVFYYNWNGVISHKALCPLEILKLAHKYDVRLCECTTTPHMIWTIWF